MVYAMLEPLDFAGFHQEDSVKQVEFCKELVAGLRKYGFVRLVNHDVSPLDIDKAFNTSRQFFELPVKEKLKSPHPLTANPHRGYSAFGVENVAATSNHGSATPVPLLKDMKESYDIGSETDPLYANIWPPPGVYDSFQPTFQAFFTSCYKAELAILEAISIGLDLSGGRTTLSQLHADQTNELRLTHYPAVARGEFLHSTRIAAHTDFGTITLLFQGDNVGGLQVENPAGSGKFVEIGSGGRHECILNVGDCLRKWTGLCSARHRVHLPEETKQAGGNSNLVPERYSIAYFAKPDRAASLRPLLPSLEDENEIYMTAGEFQNMRIQGTY
ncbi:hypothetical protein N0V93_007467 [Gnomoniopsis smithogilvyi]|uniref:Fe2OG dioxygenase domain-containing protein n=1 Tax=Gnomoniopsis smithogilvyi TaxID=1191159 RepID=A0A9W8YRW7_9PEZI|nr:hypothetical protein N0V93_007467 [Gnomoniopsis smithogilvyi]